MFIVSVLEHAVMPIKLQNQPFEVKCAKIKFGMMMTDARGKLGGQVFSKNRAGAYIRTKVTPVNPQTSFQALVRSFFTAITTGWRLLTVLQRDAFQAAVSNWTTTDIFGDSKTPSGFQLYTKLNSNLLNAGQVAISSPPLPASIPVFTIDTFLNSVTAGDMEIDGSNFPVPIDHVLIVEATPPLSPGKFFAKSEFAKIAVAGAATAGPYVIVGNYNAKYGARILGQKIFVRAKLVNTTTGQAGTYSSIAELTV